MRAASSCDPRPARSATTRSSRVSTGTHRAAIAHVVSNAVAETGEQTDVGADASDAARSQDALDDELDTGLDAEEPPGQHHSHHPGLTERVASFGRSPIVTVGAVRAVRRVHRRRHRLRHAGRRRAGRQAGAGVADAHAARADARSTASCTASRACAGAARRRAVAGAADRPRDPQLAAREERVPRHQPAAGGRELDLPAAHGRARAREVRAAPASRGRGIGSPRASSTTRSGASCSRCCSRSCAAPGLVPRRRRVLARPSAARADAHHRDAGCRSRRCSSRRSAPRPASGCSACTCSSRSPTRMRGATRARSSSARLRRAFRVWWEGVGCGFPLLAPVLIAVAYEKIAQNQETDWDFAQDVLVTHGPPGVLNTVTGVCGLAAMLWLYGVAWHQPMAESIAWARTTHRRGAAVARHAHRQLRGRRRAHRHPVAAAAPARRARERAAPPARAAAVDHARRRRRRTTSLGSSARPSTRTSSTHVRRARTRKVAVLQRRRAAHAARRQLAARRGAVPRVGRPRARERAERIAASARRCRRRATTRTRSTRSARRSSTTRATATLDAAIDRAQNGIVADFLNRYRR